MSPLSSRTAFVACAAAAAIVSQTLPAPAQSPPSLHGYLEHQLSTTRTGSGWSQLDYDRLRLDLDAEAGRGTRVSAALVWQLFRGNTRPSISDYLPDELAGQAPSMLFQMGDREYLNHAYVSLCPGPFEVIAGKQHLNWGRAMVFNPTDLFRPKNLTEPSYEREGIGALSASLPLGPLSDVMAAYVPEGGFDTSAKVLRARTHWGGFDLSLLGAELWEEPLESRFSTSAREREQRFTVGGDVSGEMWGLGIWAEGTWSSMADEDWVEFTAGANYTLPSRTFLALEGYLDGRGEWSDPYDLDRWLAIFTGFRRTAGRGMLFGTVDHPFTDLLNAGLSGLGNTGDKSVLLIPHLSCAFAQDVDLTARILIPLGPDGTEFGTRDPGGFVRVRVYF
ncbi:MAG: hypothetical protein R6W82_06210 [bacterium]